MSNEKFEKEKKKKKKTRSRAPRDLKMWSRNVA